MFLLVLRGSGIKLKFTVMVPEDDHNNTVWVGGSMLASTGALDGAYFFGTSECGVTSDKRPWVSWVVTLVSCILRQ